jgi:steroid delta-isomerase-like uncharacterized protein
MSIEENKAIVRRYLEEAWNQRNLAVIDELVAPNLIQHIRNVPPGRQGVHQFFGMLFNAFPDVHLTVEDMLAEGDTVVWRFTVRGTHQGSFRGIAPSGKRVVLTGIAISRLQDGRLAENWNETDDLGLLQQLGAVPVPQG